MKIQVGDYVRTKDGYISNVNNTNDEKIYKGNVLRLGIIKKSSSNIIDILEIGDIITTNNMVGEITNIDIENDKIWLACFDYDTVSSSDIISVMTKEQFKSGSYRIGD